MSGTIFSWGLIQRHVFFDTGALQLRPDDPLSFPGCLSFATDLCLDVDETQQTLMCPPVLKQSEQEHNVKIQRENSDHVVSCLNSQSLFLIFASNCHKNNIISARTFTQTAGKTSHVNTLLCKPAHSKWTFIVTIVMTTVRLEDDTLLYKLQ